MDNKMAPAPSETQFEGGAAPGTSLTIKWVDNQEKYFGPLSCMFCMSGCCLCSLLLPCDEKQQFEVVKH